MRRSWAVTKIFVKAVAAIKEACPIQSHKMFLEEVSGNDAALADSPRGGEESSEVEKMMKGWGVEFQKVSRF